jgi:hypothetical protein
MTFQVVKNDRARGVVGGIEWFSSSTVVPRSLYVRINIYYPFTYKNTKYVIRSFSLFIYFFLLVILCISLLEARCARCIHKSSGLVFFLRFYFREQSDSSLHVSLSHRFRFFHPAIGGGVMAMQANVHGLPCVVLRTSTGRFAGYRCYRRLINLKRGTVPVIVL